MFKTVWPLLHCCDKVFSLYTSWLLIYQCWMCAFFQNCIFHSDFLQSPINLVGDTHIPQWMIYSLQVLVEGLWSMYLISVSQWECRFFHPSHPAYISEMAHNPIALSTWEIYILKFPCSTIQCILISYKN